MSCDKCGSKRVFSINGKTSDRNFALFLGKEVDGYAPRVANICGGDYINLSICLDCGKTQGKFPVASPPASSFHLEVEPEGWGAK